MHERYNVYEHLFDRAKRIKSKEEMPPTAFSGEQKIYTENSKRYETRFLYEEPCRMIRRYFAIIFLGGVLGSLPFLQTWNKEGNFSFDWG